MSITGIGPFVGTKIAAGFVIASAGLAHTPVPPPAPVPPPPAVAVVAAPAPPMDSPVTMYDSTTLSSIPAGAGFIAEYSNGSFAGQPVPGKNIVWIDTNGSNPHANALDIEPGDASPGTAAGWVHANSNPVVILYSSISTWDAVKASVATLSPQDQSRVRYWIADPTGVPHILPGAAATQYQWNGNNWDASLVRGDFAHN